MPKTSYRKFKILGAAWIGLGGLGFAYVTANLFSLAQGNVGETEVREGFWGYFGLALVVGAIGMVNGFTLLLHQPGSAPPCTHLVVSPPYPICRPNGSLVDPCCPAYGSCFQAMARRRLSATKPVGAAWLYGAMPTGREGCTRLRGNSEGLGEQVLGNGLVAIPLSSRW